MKKAIVGPNLGGGGAPPLDPPLCVMYGIRQGNRIFSCGEISAFFAKIFFFISVVISNSSLHYQIFEIDINIQILVWIVGSTGIQKRRNFEAKVTCQQSSFSLLHEIHIGVGVLTPSPMCISCNGKIDACCSVLTFQLCFRYFPFL